MKTIQLPAVLGILDAAITEAKKSPVVLELADGERFVLTHASDEDDAEFAAEARSLGQNKEFMAYLEKAASCEHTYSLEEVKKEFGIQ